MHRLRRSLFISLVCLLLLQLVTTRAYASVNITREQWEKLSSDKAFGYKNATEAVQQPADYSPGRYDQLFSAFFAFLRSREGNIIMWIIVISIISFIIYRTFQKDSFLFGKNKKIIGTGDAQDNDEQDLATTNWEHLRQTAVQNNDLRLAVRYSYMWMLQLMQQRELIQYRIDKTNYEYYSELKETNYRQPFQQLSRQYEYAWYGRFELSQDAYGEYKELFDNTRKQLGA